MVNARPMTQKSSLEILIQKSVGKVPFASLSDNSANTSFNGLRLIDFASASNMVVCSTKFQQLDIHEATSINIQPDRSYCDWRKARIQRTRCVHTQRYKPDHYLVATKFWLRISASRSARSSALWKLDVKKLRLQRTVEAFFAQLSDKLRLTTSNLSVSGGLWANITHRWFPHSIQ